MVVDVVGERKERKGPKERELRAGEMKEGSKERRETNRTRGGLISRDSLSRPLVRVRSGH